MNANYTAVVKNQDNCWIGWIEEVPGVNCQESSREALLESLLKQAFSGAAEEMR